ncbi:adenylate/guanylate cyclase domain-containing protein [Mycolicibacterium diernhoferi]|uniref:Adenylate/guanylate cyclase domain-containing protein n=1 Tax=Mycolicibacterium diernhoferi TaxID=1801 RepID=A0A1Q4H8H7_9MYCO|nr:adenylate/guanylate cyclase domain-containing protein [Mycolicibacterium diernhoferi]OJZ63813.1 adenylate/guanylate cyclase domain-containing protein [Mycolicibacterium diernhoferi]OPE45165.1 adenylate/guanylate cyclase domain-containing protein [Mycolicibacterium diernhoferi]PEG54303.1 adenylate/guanylate cyclase domain-containing protein [Mycolicibacterium diernhoferi]QYL21554.1 adenylate/guanylate cyclase domain-containing protein [Mycolicibacterium diernhoferi]
MGADFDIESSGLLDGLEGQARAERAELIPWLLAHGVTIEQIRESYTPVLLASRRILGDDGEYVSARQISANTGIDLALLQRIQRVLGLPRVDDPDEPVHLRVDGEIARYAQQFVEIGIDEDNLVMVVRALADGLAKTAEAMRFTSMSAVMAPGVTELEVAASSEALLQRVNPLLGPMIEDMLRLELRRTMETEAVTAGERAEGLPLPGARQVSVAFADLVGFTRLGEAVPPEELEGLANHLVELTHEVVAPPVRFIKSIGDAVMLVSPEAEPLLTATLALLDAAAADEDFPRLRVGLASGMAVSRGGDWFGSPVNLASRVTGAARPGAVLVTETVRAEVGEDTGVEWSFAGAKRLKGIKDEVKLFRARRTQ